MRPATFLGRYGPTDYWWGSWKIKDERGSFHVWSDAKESTVRTLDEAFGTAGLDPSRARRWFERTDQLRIYAVRKLDDGAGIEIRFVPGAHGLRYAPNGNDGAFEALKSPDRSRSGGVMKPMTGRWFYFADEAPGQNGRRQ